MAWCKTTPWIKANLCHDMHVMCMRTPPRKFQSPDCGNFIDTNVFNQTFRIYTQTMMEKTFFDVRVFNPHAFSNRNQTPFACYRKHKREKKRTYAQRILEVEHSSFTPLVFSATCRRNRERSNLFLQTSWLLYARFEVGSLIQHHTLLAEMPIDLLPVCSAIQSLRRARSSQHHVVHSPPPPDAAFKRPSTFINMNSRFINTNYRFINTNSRFINTVHRWEGTGLCSLYQVDLKLNYVTNKFV